MNNYDEQVQRSAGADARAKAQAHDFTHWVFVVQWLEFNQTGAILAKLHLGGDDYSWQIVKDPS